MVDKCLVCNANKLNDNKDRKFMRRIIIYKNFCVLKPA